MAAQIMHEMGGLVLQQQVFTLYKSHLEKPKILEKLFVLRHGFKE